MQLQYTMEDVNGKWNWHMWSLPDYLKINFDHVLVWIERTPYILMWTLSDKLPWWVGWYARVRNIYDMITVTTRCLSSPDVKKWMVTSKRERIAALAFWHHHLPFDHPWWNVYEYKHLHVITEVGVVLLSLHQHRCWGRSSCLWKSTERGHPLPCFPN